MTRIVKKTLDHQTDLVYSCFESQKQPATKQEGEDMDSTKNTKIRIRKPGQLYCRYPGQTAPQGTYIYLDCRDGEFGVDYNPEVGNAIPFGVYHGHVQRIGIDILTQDAIEALLIEIAPLAQRVVDGYSSVWDDNNYVARFAADALQALEEIQARCARPLDDDDILQVWVLGDWWGGSIEYRDQDNNQCHSGDVVRVIVDNIGEVTGKTTDNEIGDLAKKMRTLSDSEDIHIDGDEVDFLTELRDQCKNNEK